MTSNAALQADKPEGPAPKMATVFGETAFLLDIFPRSAQKRAVLVLEWEYLGVETNMCCSCYFAYKTFIKQKHPAGGVLVMRSELLSVVLFKKQSLGPQPKVLKVFPKHDRNYGLTYCVVDFPKAMSIPDREGFACLSKNMSLK